MADFTYTLRRRFWYEVFSIRIDQPTRYAYGVAAMCGVALGLTSLL